MLKILEDGLHGFGDVQGRLLPDSVNAQFDGVLPVELRVKARFFKAVGDLGQVRQGQPRTRFRRDYLDISEFFSPLLALFHAQENFSGVGFDGTGGDVFARLGDDAGDLPQREVVFTQPILRNFHVGDIVGHVAEFDLRDRGIAQQAHP